MGRRVRRQRSKKNKSSMTPEQRIELRQKLNEVITDYLQDPTEPNVKSYVNETMKRVVRPALKGSYSAEVFTGSSYELSALPGTSDFDVQVYLKMPGSPGKRNKVKPNTGILEQCDRPGWRKVRGGLQHLLTAQGYLSAKKVRRDFQSKIDSFIARNTPNLPFEVSRTESGPATTLVLSRKDSRASVITTIDVVACVNGTQIYPKTRSWNLVAKPYNKENPDDHEDCWRMSCSQREKKRFAKTYANRPRVLTMLKILKLLKEADPQFHQFPSYFYKNIMLRYLGKYGGVEHWDREAFDLRFEGLMREIYEVLVTGVLKVFYNPEENLLAKTSSISYEPLQNRLQDVIRRGAYIELLN